MVSFFALALLAHQSFGQLFVSMLECCSPETCISVLSISLSPFLEPHALTAWVIEFKANKPMDREWGRQAPCGGVFLSLVGPPNRRFSFWCPFKPPRFQNGYLISSGKLDALKGGPDWCHWECGVSLCEPNRKRTTLPCVCELSLQKMNLLPRNAILCSSINCMERMKLFKRAPKHVTRTGQRPGPERGDLAAACPKQSMRCHSLEMCLHLCLSPWDNYPH